MKKSNIILCSVIFALTAAVIVLGVLHWRSLPKSNDGFTVKINGEEYNVGQDVLQSIGIIDFTAKKKNVETKYQGVPWLALAEKLDIKTDGAKSCVAKASDGYVSAVPIAKMNQPDNVYIAITEEDGPFLLVIKNDAFSQYWCKHLVEMSFQ